MPTLTIATLPLAQAENTGRVSCVITNALGTLRLPATSPEVDYMDLGMTQWQEIPRSGDTPILAVAGKSRAKVKLTGYLFDYKGVTADQQVTALRRFAAGDKPVSVAFGQILSAATWVITGCTVSTERLVEGSNDVLHATFMLELTAWAAKKPTVASTTKTAKGKKPTRKVAVRKGETIAQFAARVCGDASHLSTIAKANGIRDPRKVKAGQVLTVNC